MFAFVRNLFAGLSERERRLVAAMGFVFGGMVLFIFVFFVQTGVSDLERETLKYTKALALIAEKEQSFRENQRELLQRGRSRGKPTPLRTLVDKISKQLNVTIPDQKELPDQRHAGGWLEKSIELSMREIGLADLTKFMESVEGNRKRFPIAITKLEIRKRKRVPDSYDVKMIVATYEAGKAEQASSKKPGSGHKGGR